MTRRSLIISILLILIAGCREEYYFQLESITSKPVVQAEITNKKGPYYVRLTKSRSDLGYDPSVIANDPPKWSPDTTWSYYDDRAKAITDAEVFIEDNTTGVNDTLEKCKIGTWHHYIDTINHYESSHFYVTDTGILSGYYQTTKIVGIPGHTYTLKIKWQDKEYHSVSYLPALPAIDSVHFNFTKGEIGKEDYNIPLLFFKEPQNERNYYLFVTSGGYGRAWPYSVLSDEYLKDYVNGLDVCHGVAPDYWMTAYPDFLTDYYSIEMHSLTREGYDFYKALIEQFNNDGGAYSPTPATPPGNIDNGALGFFKTSSVVKIEFFNQRHKKRTEIQIH